LARKSFLHSSCRRLLPPAQRAAHRCHPPGMGVCCACLGALHRCLPSCRTPTPPPTFLHCCSAGHCMTAGQHMRAFWKTAGFLQTYIVHSRSVYATLPACSAWTRTLHLPPPQDHSHFQHLPPARPPSLTPHWHHHAHCCGSFPWTAGRAGWQRFAQHLRTLATRCSAARRRTGRTGRERTGDYTGPHTACPHSRWTPISAPRRWTGLPATPTRYSRHHVTAVCLPPLDVGPRQPCATPHPLPFHRACWPLAPPPAIAFPCAPGRCASQDLPHRTWFTAGGGHTGGAVHCMTTISLLFTVASHYHCLPHLPAHL